MRRLITIAFIVGLPSLTVADDPWSAPESARRQTAPFELDEAAAAAGKVHYDERCIMCHGATGLGDGKSAGFLMVPPGDLSSVPCQDQTDGELYWKISEGRRPMPGFESKMTAEELWQVIAFIRTLAAEPAEAE